MKRLADTAYWIYASGVTGSFALAFYAFSKLGDGGRLSVGPVGTVEVALGFMAITLAFGLFFAMPVLRKHHSEQEQLTDRAAKLEVAVVTDPLTGLYNRRYFEDALSAYVSEFNRMGATLAVLSLDLDHFKSVNDTYGHDAGDIVLKQLAVRLKQVVREHDIIARTGGEEFCIVAPFSHESEIRPFAERVGRTVGEMRVDVGAVILRPTVSIGVASTSDGQKSVKDLLKVSDERLYEAKQLGRNRVCT